MANGKQASVTTAAQLRTVATEGELLQLLVDNIADYGITMLDLKGTVLTWTSASERLLGWKSGEIIGQHFSRFYPPEDIARGKTDTELKVTSEEGRFEDEGWRVRKDGSRFWA